MGTRLARVAVMILALVSGGCGSSDRDPYADLSKAAAPYVIPGSGEWTFGELCSAGSDCSGPMGFDAIEQFQWVRFDEIEVQTKESREKSVDVALSVVEADDVSSRAPAPTRAWGPSVDEVQRVLAMGHELWAGSSPGEGYVAVFVAFDEQGRFAGVGHAAAEYFTIPVAELAVDAEAPTGEAYLRPLMAG